MTAAEVMLWGTRIGTVVFDSRTGLGSFEYDRDFLRSGIEVSPLMMPLSERVYVFPELRGESFKGLPGLLSDSLPDKFGNAVIDAWLRKQGRAPESFDPVERLCYTGKRGMGALEYVPARGPMKEASSDLEISRLVSLAAEILAEREAVNANLKDTDVEDIIRVSSSAGGARAKALIAWNPETNAIRSGQIDAGSGFEYWLLKFDGVDGNGDKEGADGPQYTNIEYAYYLMARDAGIDMSDCRLFRENGRCHFMTRRFDRDFITGAKIHMQTLGGIAHLDFNAPAAASYEQAAEVMRRIRVPRNEVIRFYRRMVLNVLARNQDDHVKNISFLMDRRGNWHLSPAYDVTYAYNPAGAWTGAHQMTVNGKTAGITREDLLVSAKVMGVRDREAEEALTAVSESLQKWTDFAETAGIRERTAEGIRRNFVEV